MWFCSEVSRVEKEPSVPRRAGHVLSFPRQMDTLTFSKTPRFKRGKPHLEEGKV